MGVEGGVRVIVAVEEVTVMPETMTLKLRIEGFAGRWSATKVKVRLAGPPPQLTVQTTPPGLPLQEAKPNEASKIKTSRALLRFMEYPHGRLVCVCPD